MQGIKQFFDREKELDINEKIELLDKYKKDREYLIKNI